MKKIFITAGVAICSIVFGQNQVGINTPQPHQNAALEVFSESKGFLPPRLTTEQRDAIDPIPAGLTIYNSTINCMQYWNSQLWKGDCEEEVSPGVITNCSDADLLQGTYQEGIAMTASNMMTLKINADQIGTYTISSNTVNGITFTATADITATGPQEVILTASGTPTASGDYEFTFTFGDSTCMRNINFTENSGEGTITDCTTTALDGTYKQGNAMTSQNKITLEVDITQLGPWTASSNTVNGIAFTGSGTFTTTGVQNIELTADGTPTASGSQGFTFTFGSSTCERAIIFESDQTTPFDLNCSDTTSAGSLTAGTAASGVTVKIPYVGGDGSAYSAQTVNVTPAPVYGLKAELAAGNFNNGSGDLLLNITGTPIGYGTANFTFTINGKTCTFSVTVAQLGNAGPGACTLMGLPSNAALGEYYAMNPNDPRSRLVCNVQSATMRYGWVDPNVCLANPTYYWYQTIFPYYKYPQYGGYCSPTKPPYLE